MIRRHSLFRVVASLVANELSVLRGRPVDISAQLTWTEDTRLDDAPSSHGSLSFDSLARLDVSGRLNNFFHMHETGVEDYLLTQKTLGGLVDVVTAAMKLGFARMTFQTSGSTGQPKPCMHETASLMQETLHLASMFSGAKRVIALVPPHHIYGFLFTVLLPEELGIDVEDARLWPPSRMARELGKGDVVIATPHMWRYLAASVPSLAQGVTGVTSTAPMPDVLKTDLSRCGLTDLIEIYGSSETAGIGSRSLAETAFSLFPYWQRDMDNLVRIRADGLSAEPVRVMDKLVWSDANHFIPSGRTDGAVQVGGINVFPDRVAAIIRQHERVADCTVRITHLGGDMARARLKVFVVPLATSGETDVTDDGLARELEQYADAHLAPLERPAMWQFGERLPRNAMGKLVDW